MNPALVALLIQAGLTYGPQFITDIKNLMNKTNVTIEDIETVFANVKPYSAYGISAVVSADKPTPPTTVAGLPTSIPPQ